MVYKSNRHGLRFCSAVLMAMAVTFALSVSVAPSMAFAQDEDADDTNVGQGPPKVETNPIVLTVRDSNPKTMEELAEAVQIMVDLDRDDEAKKYLTTLASTKADDMQWFLLSKKYSTAFLLEINSRPGLAPANTQLTRTILTAIRNINSDPARLNGLVKQLNDSSEIKRAEALADLRNLGAPAAAAILTALADDSRSDEFQNLVRGLRRIGSLGEAPIRAGLLSPSRRVQIVCADVLEDYKSRASVEMLLATMIANKKDGLLNQTAWLTVSKMIGREPEDSEAEATVLRSAISHLYQKEALVGDFENKIAVWDWKDRQMIGTRVDKHVASRIFAFRRAQAVYAYNPESNRMKRLYFLCLLDAAKLRGGIDKPLNMDSLDQELAADVGFVERVLLDALDSKRVPAAIAATELLAAKGDATLVASKDGRLRPLLQAMTWGDRRLQYAATMAILQLGPTNSYPGSSHVSRSLVHLVGSNGRPSSIIGHVNRMEGQTMIATLQQVGVDGDLATNAKDVFQYAVNDSDAEFLLISDTLDWPDYAELVQQIRHDWRTRRTPIALLTRTQNQRRGERIASNDPFMVQIPWSTDPSILARQITRLKELNTLTRVDANERAAHAAKAAEWLNKIATDKELAAVYQLATHEEPLNAALFLPNVGASISNVVARLATRKGQRALLSLINDSGQPDENRRAAVDAFTYSIKKSGTLLTSAELLQQYERYNASEFEDEESQKILGAVLDSIEKRAGKKKDQ